MPFLSSGKIVMIEYDFERGDLLNMLKKLGEGLMKRV
jgi:hypothetical protein